MPEKYTSQKDGKTLVAAPVIEIVTRNHGYDLVSNGSPLKTPEGRPLHLPSRRLADMIALEWNERNQSKETKGSLSNIALSMPLTQHAFTALDIFETRRRERVEEILAYATTDLLCYRALEPLELYQRQQKSWQPLLDWCAGELHAPLLVTRGLMPVVQPSTSLKNFETILTAYNNFFLEGLQEAVRLSGSLVLGLALLKKHLTADQVFERAELDQYYQIEKWGEDPAQQARLNSVKKDLRVCEMWFELLSSKDQKTD